MVKLKFQFTTWAGWKYYRLIVNGKELPINVLRSGKDMHGNEDIHIVATTEEMDIKIMQVFPNKSRRGYIKASDVENCKGILTKIVA